MYTAGVTSEGRILHTVFRKTDKTFSENESGTLGFVRSISTVWGYRSQVYASFLPYDPRGQKGRKHGNKSQKIYGQLQR